MKEYKKILCITSTGMGNSILYVPVLRTLRNRFPDARIDVIVSNKPAKALIENLGLTDKVLLFEKSRADLFKYIKLLFVLRKEKYELFITSYLDRSFKIAFLGFLAGIPERIGFANDWWKRFYKIRVPIIEKKHEVEYNLDLLRAIGISETDTSIEMPISNKQADTAASLLKKTDRLMIGFHPGSGTDLGESVKRWNVAKFALLADILAVKTNAEILIFGGPEELNLAKEMASKMKAVPRILVGTPILITAALMKKCDMFVSNDSGLMHLAAAVKIPVVGIFGPTLYWKNYPWQVPHAVIKSALACAPCYKFSGISCRNQRCLLGISVNMVLEQAVDLLKIPGFTEVLNSAIAAMLSSDQFDSKAVYEQGTAAIIRARPRKVTVITPDFSHNCVGRSFMIAELLMPLQKVEIVGPAFEGNVWEPIAKAPHNVDYKFISCHKWKYFFSNAFRLANLVSGDVAIISKPVLPSMFLALIVGIIKNIPIVMDIDDWEIGFEVDRFVSSKLINKLKSSANIMKLVICDLLARLIKYKIVSNNYLRNKYGGIIIPHVRETSVFNPDLYSKYEIRNKFGITPEKKVILFLGTPREHKGIIELVTAFQSFSDKSTVLMLVGFNLIEKTQKTLYDFVKEKLGEKCILLEQQPFEKIPEFLSMVDVVVIPQRNTQASKGQIPAKLFDAMAMGKPIIASRVNDIPEILEDCGWTYEPSDINQLIEIMKQVLSDPEKAALMGKKAREKCIKKYSYDAARQKIEDQICLAYGVQNP